MSIFLFCIICIVSWIVGVWGFAQIIGGFQNILIYPKK